MTDAFNYDEYYVSPQELVSALDKCHGDFDALLPVLGMDKKEYQGKSFETILDETFKRLSTCVKTWAAMEVAPVITCGQCACIFDEDDIDEDYNGDWHVIGSVYRCGRTGDYIDMTDIACHRLVLTDVEQEELQQRREQMLTEFFTCQPDTLPE